MRSKSLPAKQEAKNLHLSVFLLDLIVTAFATCGFALVCYPRVLQAGIRHRAPNVGEAAAAGGPEDIARDCRGRASLLSAEPWTRVTTSTSACTHTERDQAEEQQHLRREARQVPTGAAGGADMWFRVCAC